MADEDGLLGLEGHEAFLALKIVLAHQVLCDRSFVVSLSFIVLELVRLAGCIASCSI